MVDNPYIAGNPVAGTAVFVGRADVLGRVSRELGRDHHNAVLLYGQRRIGKTSILKELERQLPFHAVYFDLQFRGTRPIGEVVSDLAAVIADRMGLAEPDLGEHPERAFRREWLPDVLRLVQGRLVILMDEFDVVDTPAVGQAVHDLFPYLDALIREERQRLGFVFVIGRSYDELSNLGQSLFKDMSRYRISLLERDNTEALIGMSASGGLVWTEAATERVWTLTGGHPYLTQQLCSSIWELAHDESVFEIDVSRVDAAVDETLDVSGSMLEWLWKGLPPAERLMASALAAGGPEPIREQRAHQILREAGARRIMHELQQAPRRLVAWDLLEREEDLYRFRVELMRRWIERARCPQEVSDELDRVIPRAQALFLAAQVYLEDHEDRNLDEGIRQLEHVLRLNDNHGRARLLLADCLLERGEEDAGVEQLNLLFTNDPAKARVRLTEVLQARLERSSDESEQLEILEQLRVVDPGNSEVASLFARIWHHRGVELESRGSWQRAEKAYRSAGAPADADRMVELYYAKKLRLVSRGVARALDTHDVDTAQALLNKSELLHDDAVPLQLSIDELSRKLSQYEESAVLLAQGRRLEAAAGFAQVASMQPDFKDVVRQLHLSVTGKDPKFLEKERDELRRDLTRRRSQLAEARHGRVALSEEKRRIEAEAEQLRWDRLREVEDERHRRAETAVEHLRMQEEARARLLEAERQAASYLNELKTLRKKVHDASVSERSPPAWGMQRIRRSPPVVWLALVCTVALPMMSSLWLSQGTFPCVSVACTLDAAYALRSAGESVDGRVLLLEGCAGGERSLCLEADIWSLWDASPRDEAVQRVSSACRDEGHASACRALVAKAVLPELAEKPAPWSEGFERPAHGETVVQAALQPCVDDPRPDTCLGPCELGSGQACGLAAAWSFEFARAYPFLHELACGDGVGESCAAAADAAELTDPDAWLYLHRESCRRAGDIEHCWRAAGALAHGIAWTHDLSAAQSLFQRACDGGDVPACVELAELWTPIDRADESTREDARELAQRGCSAGAPRGCGLVAAFALRDADSDEACATARRRLERMCEADAGECGWAARAWAGDLSHCVRTNRKLAIDYAQRACLESDGPSCALAAELIGETQPDTVERRAQLQLEACIAERPVAKSCASAVRLLRKAVFDRDGAERVETYARNACRLGYAALCDIEVRVAPVTE